MRKFKKTFCSLSTLLPHIRTNRELGFHFFEVTFQSNFAQFFSGLSYESKVTLLCPQSILLKYIICYQILVNYLKRLNWTNRLKRQCLRKKHQNIPTKIYLQHIHLCPPSLGSSRVIFLIKKKKSPPHTQSGKVITFLCSQRKKKLQRAQSDHNSGRKLKLWLGESGFEKVGCE